MRSIERSVDRDGEDDPGLGANGKATLLGVASAVLFLGGLLVSETIGEMALDVDFKPFFLPYLLIALSRYGIPTLSIGLGAAVGEGVLDVFEGYEIDDPIGFIGYTLGFTAFGWYVHEVVDDPTATRSLAVGAVLGAFVQALFEGVAFLIFEEAASTLDATISVLGNTVTHGVLLGAIPLVVLYGPTKKRVGERLA